LATISSGLCRFLTMGPVLLRLSRAIPQGGPLQGGRITARAARFPVASVMAGKTRAPLTGGGAVPEERSGAQSHQGSLTMREMVNGSFRPRKKATQARQPLPGLLSTRGTACPPSATPGPHRRWPLPGYDGAKRKKGSKLHMAVDTLGYLPAAHVTPATTDDRAEVVRCGGPSGDWPERGSGLCGPGLHGREARCRSARARDRAGSGPLARGQAGICPSAPALGGRANLRLGHPLPPARARLRAPAQTLADLHVIALVCIMLK
jgi:DDE family transposase